MVDKPFAPSCERNQLPIYQALYPYLTTESSPISVRRTVLELGSGTGQHAVFLAPKFPEWDWQPSEIKPALAGIELWRRDSLCSNVLPAIELDVGKQPWPPLSVERIFTANTLHIISADLVVRMFNGVASVLKPKGLFLVYGPFSYDGVLTSESNKAFDLWLKERDSHSGIRDVTWLKACAQDNGLSLIADHPMPANNQMLVFGFSKS